MRRFTDLSERELLALAISNEEEDGRILADFAHALRENYPDTAHVFADMAAEEQAHRRELIDLFVQRFGDHIPLVRRDDIRGFLPRASPWQVQRRGMDAMRRHARQMELDAARFYRQAAARTTDAAIRRLLGDLAAAEDAHEQAAGRIELNRLPASAREAEDEEARRRFALQVVQPGLVGLMDGSVSTLAPVFAAAVATHDPWNAFLVGIAASVGAGISMGFAEALSDDGRLSGRGAPLLRGLICGLMTAAGGIGHTLPFLLRSYGEAMGLAIAVVAAELALITWIRWRYQDTPPLAAATQIAVGGGLVFAAGLLIGSA
ncbi:iron exporter MbfA [Rhizosaccharibacter radicis]|uniref:Rubrerythrin n=1 Tax=Rhizosaccharibacter radicis TaxID=2782605 RepID=A0ABT1VSY6_9PROT|nr:rubrerythrin [Acetobacteraceae bacterium KSS12]